MRNGKHVLGESSLHKAQEWDHLLKTNLGRFTIIDGHDEGDRNDDEPWLSD